MFENKRIVKALSVLITLLFSINNLAYAAPFTAAEGVDKSTLQDISSAQEGQTPASLAVDLKTSSAGRENFPVKMVAKKLAGVDSSKTPDSVNILATTQLQAEEAGGISWASFLYRDNNFCLRPVAAAQRSIPHIASQVKEHKITDISGPDVELKGKGLFLKRLFKILLASCFIGGLIYVVHITGNLNWYIQLKSGYPSGVIFHWTGAVIDMITGMIMWGISDAAGQYLHQGRSIRIKQSILVGFFGIFQGLLTHILFSSIDNLPRFLNLPTYLLSGTGSKVLRTGLALTGGFFISLILARAISLGRRLTIVADYDKKKEWEKTVDVIAAKLIVAPPKTFIVINLLPFHIRVLSEQIWDYIMTIFSAYLMNRREPLFARFILKLKKKEVVADEVAIQGKVPESGSFENPLTKKLQQRLSRPANADRAKTFSADAGLAEVLGNDVKYPLTGSLPLRVLGIQEHLASAA